MIVCVRSWMTSVKHIDVHLVYSEQQIVLKSRRAYPGISLYRLTNLKEIAVIARPEVQGVFVVAVKPSSCYRSCISHQLMKVTLPSLGYCVSSGAEPERKLFVIFKKYSHLSIFNHSLVVEDLIAWPYKHLNCQHLSLGISLSRNIDIFNIFYPRHQLQQ